VTSAIRLVLAFAASDWQDTIPGPRRLDEFVALARAAHPALVAARERQLAAAEQVKAVGRPEDPMLEIGSMNRSLPRFGRSSPVAMDQIRLVQAIPLGGRLRLTTQAAQARAEAAQSAVAEADRRLRWQVTDAVIALRQSDQTVAFLGVSRAALEQLHAVSRARYAATRASQAELIRAQLELARLAEEEIVARADRQEGTARLNGLLVRPPDTPIGAVSLPALPDSLPPLDSLIRRAVTDHPSVIGLRSGRAAWGHERQRVASERWPDLEVGLGYGQQPMFGESGTDRMVSLSIGGRIPLWSRPARQAMEREAAAMERMASAEATAIEAEFAARIGELAVAFGRANRLVELARSTLAPQARAAATSALAGYQNGAIDFEAVGSAHLAVIRIELDVVRLEADRARAVAELQYLTGIEFGVTAEGGSR